MRYHDFDLAIERGEGGTIALKSWCDEHGEYRDVATLDPASLEQDRALLAGDAVAHDTLIAVGSRLYGYTFAAKGGAIEWHFAQCIGATTKPAGGVRVRLRVEQPELAAIPWEYIYSGRLRCFFSVSERTPIVRYLELPQAIPSLEAPLPIRVLIAIPDQSGLDTATEKKEILAALEPLEESVEVTLLEGPVSRRSIAKELGEKEFHVFHFIGHGDFENDRAVVLLKGQNGEDEWLDQDRMAGLFRNHPSMKLVVLNSCRGGQLSASKPFVGMAAGLVRQGVPAVIAMQYEVMDDEAICFARELYSRLFTGRDRGRIEIAVSNARSALAEEFPDTRAVGLPVLFMHTREGVLFKLDTGNLLRDLPLSARSAERVKAIARTHEHNLELIKSRGARALAPPVATGDAPEVQADDRREVEQFERTERQMLARANRQLRFRNAAIVIAVAVALVVGLAASFFGFHAVHPWFQPASYFVAFSDFFHHHEEQDAVTLVAIDSATTQSLGRSPDGTWRSRHATVVRRLVEAGAPVIAFNFSFNPTAGLTAQNDSFATALRSAQSAGTTVLATVDAFEQNGTPRAEPVLAPYVRWGPNCVGAGTTFSAKAFTLASGSVGAGRGGRIASLPLQAVASLHAVGGRSGAPEIESAIDRLIGTIALDSMSAGGTDDRCGFARGDTLVRMALDYAPRDEHRDPQHRISYLSVLRGAALGDLHRRLILVGWENPSSMFSVVRGLSSEQRFGVELEADAMNTLLRQIRIAPLGMRAQFAVILGMAALGALAAYLVGRIGRGGAALVAVAGLVAYFIGGATLYARDHALLNTLFDFTALLLAFTAVLVARKVWFP